GFVKSSLERKMTDAEISRYLRTVKLSQRLSDNQFEDLLTIGLGQRSLQALHAIHDASSAMPSAEVTSTTAKPPAEPLAAPSLQDQAAIITAVREYALSYSRNLPNFLCAQQVHRKV